MSIKCFGKIKHSIHTVLRLWKDHDQKILTFLAIILTAMVSFQAGTSHQKEKEIAAINVNLNQKIAGNPEQEKLQAIAGAMDRKGIDVAKLAQNANSAGAANSGQGEVAPEAVVAGETSESQDQQCAFVGSKNSNKYHLPSCRYAANIKPENKVCFSSKEDAETRGYVGGGCCIK